MYIYIYIYMGWTSVDQERPHPLCAKDQIGQIGDDGRSAENATKPRKHDGPERSRDGAGVRNPWAHTYVSNDAPLYVCMYACLHSYVHIHTCIHTLHYITLHYITLHYITLHTCDNIKPFANYVINTILTENGDNKNRRVSLVIIILVVIIVAAILTVVTI